MVAVQEIMAANLRLTILQQTKILAKVNKPDRELTVGAMLSKILVGEWVNSKWKPITTFTTLLRDTLPFRGTFVTLSRPFGPERVRRGKGLPRQVEVTDKVKVLLRRPQVNLRPI